MKPNTIELKGRIYENVDALKERLGISDFAIRTYLKRDFPKPVLIGSKRFFDPEKVEEWFLAREPV